jgi:hypothetical protein
MIIFSQLQTGPCARISGLDVTSPDFLEYCNNAVEQLMTRGGWWSAVRAVDCCVNGRMLTWPRGVGTILALNQGRHPTVIQNKWYQFRPIDEWHHRCGLDIQRNGHHHHNRITEVSGTSPVFNPIQGQGFTIRTYISQPCDVGKTITYFGLDGNGQVIRTKRSDGTIQDGVQIVLQNPYADTPFQIQVVNRVVKDMTDGYLNCYQYFVATGMMLDLAQYQPSETTPEYITTRSIGGRMCCDGEHVSALVKLRFVPFYTGNDLVQIDNQNAIRDMIFSIRKKEAGDIGAAAEYESSAIHELNRELEDKSPDEQIVFENRTFGGAIPHRRIY